MMQQCGKCSTPLIGKTGDMATCGCCGMEQKIKPQHADRNIYRRCYGCNVHLEFEEYENGHLKCKCPKCEEVFIFKAA
jgi:hypothetical protein